MVTVSNNGNLMYTSSQLAIRHGISRAEHSTQQLYMCPKGTGLSWSMLIHHRWNTSLVLLLSARGNVVHARPSRTMRGDTFDKCKFFPGHFCTMEIWNCSLSCCSCMKPTLQLGFAPEGQRRVECSSYKVQSVACKP